MRVLLVSTSPQVSLQVRTALLGIAGLDITEVRTPQRSLAVLDEQIADGEASTDFDIIIADNDTAPTGGFYLARDLQARRDAGVDVPPVVLLLARAADQFLARWANADAFVIKPVDPFDLGAVVEALVDGEPVPALPRVGTSTASVPPTLDAGEEGRAAEALPDGP